MSTYEDEYEGLEEWIDLEDAPPEEPEEPVEVVEKAAPSDERVAGVTFTGDPQSRALIQQ